MNTRCLVTLATCGYLPRALAAVISFEQHNPGWDTILLVADASESSVRAAAWTGPEGLRVLGMDALAEPRLAGMRQYFSALEYCCAAKSFLVWHALFRLEYEYAVYLDPDALCFGSFDPVLNEMRHSELVVTPHSLTPMPDDGELPDNLELAITGYVNAGFLAARRGKGSRSAIEWLQRRVEELGFFMPDAHLYADQTWMSALPWYFPDAVGVLRDPGFNIAYWNLHERTLAFTDRGLTSNGVPAAFVHFSGYDARDPSNLTMHTRRKLSETNQRAVAKLLDTYRNALTKAACQIPAIHADLPCSGQPFAQRSRAYRGIHGKRPPIRQARRVGVASIASRLKRIVQSI